MPQPDSRTSPPAGAPDPALPFFAYGTIKQGQPGFHQLARFEPRVDADVTLPGALMVRDGLPLLNLTGRGLVHGQLLHFDGPRAHDAYAAISAFEPGKHYKWRAANTSGGHANVLEGRMMGKGHPEEVVSGRWTLDLDPVFCHAMDVVSEFIESDGRTPFASTPSFREWPRAYRLQSAYLLLWTVIERYTALAFGAGIEPTQRVKSLGNHAPFLDALRARTMPDSRRKVVDSRDPDSDAVLDSDKLANAPGFYYQVRSNLSHRGKGAWHDAELVRNALVELHSVASLMLNTYRESAASTER